MDFCKENDKYISLYIDELLDDRIKIEFLKHIEECSECASKFKEASYIRKLCSENQDIELPENFSSSLHKRLLEVKENKSKFEFFMQKKRLIASFSTAAILVISLLAYHLLPQMGTMKASTRAVNDSAQVEASRAADSNLGGSEDNSNIADKDTVKSASSENSAASTQTDSNTETEDAQNSIIISKVAPETRKKTTEPSTYRANQDNAEHGSSTKGSSKKKETNDIAMFSMRLEDKTDPNNQQYFLNYAELNLKVSSAGIEIEELRKFMNEIGATEPKPVTINSIVGNSAESTKTDAPTDTSADTTAETSVGNPEYIDFYLPLSLYSTLESQAAKHELELNTKTDIIKTDITDIYKELNTQKIENDRKIEEALKTGKDTTGFETEKTRLTEEISKIVSENEMVTVRISFIL